MEAAIRYYTPEEYLEIEHRAEYKSEYINGQIYAMSGASRAHGLLALSIGGRLDAQLRGRSCEAFVSVMRVRVSDTGLYTYPDVVVACGEIQYERAETDTLLTPAVVFEVLSPSTEAYDRGAKFEHYRHLPSLNEYVLVAQDRMLVEQFTREGKVWVLRVHDQMEDVLRLECIGCELRIGDLYERVSLPENPPAR
jgi:Uma2 family endonuclease